MSQLYIQMLKNFYLIACKLSTNENDNTIIAKLRSVYTK